MLGGAGEHHGSSDTEAEQRDGEGGDAVLEPALLVFLDVLDQGATRMARAANLMSWALRISSNGDGVKPRGHGSGSVILLLETTS